MASANEENINPNAEIRTLMFSAYRKHFNKKKPQRESMPEVDLVHRILEQDKPKNRYKIG